MKKYFPFIIFISIADISFSQSDSLHLLKNIGFEYEKKWNYISFNDTLNVDVIIHNNSISLCGIFAFASSTIVKLETGDTLRVLSLCNTSRYKAGQKIKIVYSKKPSFEVNLPFTSKWDYEIKKMNVSYYDKFITSTVWAKIL